MRKPLKTLLASTLLVVLAQQVSAEAPPFFNSFGMQAPPPPSAWNSQAPIMWADCVPVPENVANQMVATPMPMGNGALPLPPLGPFFNSPPPPPAPMMFPMPPLAAAPVVPANCDNSAKDELLTLQQHYDKAAAASKEKITGMEQTLADAQNQLADSRVIIEKLTKEQSATSNKAASEVNASKEEITKLKAELAAFDSSNKSLKSKLGAMESSSGAQARKLTALGQSSSKLVALQSAYKARNDEVALLKAKLAKLDNANKSLKSKFGALESSAGSQARKLTALGQSATELTALQSAYKARNDENAELKKKLLELSNANKTLQSKMGSLESNAGSQARKLNALGQSATELTALQSAYKARNDENAELKNKLSALGQSATELTALQTAYRMLNDGSAELKTKLANSVGAVEACNSEIIDLKSKLANLDDEKNKSLAALDTSNNELNGLKESCKKLGTANDDLAKKLADATADGDKDGVLDHSDKCPSSPAGSDVNAEGCPNIDDADKDGIADAADMCPSSVAGSKVNDFGCGPSESITLEGVNFITGSSSLTAESLPILNAAATTIKKNSGLQLEISGHTDNQGGSAINKSLSQRRANSVMIHLIKEGVEASKLIAKGYGDQNPIADNKTAAGRKSNRRVELKIRQ
jgi:OOP family OmpA-OmpF porin